MKLFKAIGAILSFFLSIIFFLLLLAFISLLFTEHLVQEKTLNKYLETVNIISLPAEGSLKEKYQENETIKDIIENELKKYNIPSNLSEKILESDGLTKLVSKITSQFSKYILFNEEKPQLTITDIYEAIDITEITNYLTIDEKVKFDTFLESIIIEVNNEIPERKEVLSSTLDSDQFKNEIEILSSSYFLLAIICCFIIIYFTISLFRWSLYKPLIWVGIPTIIIGALLMISYFVQLIGIKYIISTNGTIEVFIIKLLETTFIDILITGAIVTVIGIIITTVYSKIKKNKEKQELKELK